jgi:hypothetical protein
MGRTGQYYGEIWAEESFVVRRPRDLSTLSTLMREQQKFEEEECFFKMSEDT